LNDDIKNCKGTHFFDCEYNNQASSLGIISDLQISEYMPAETQALCAIIKVSQMFAALIA
jgi:hypothetical protein